MVLVSRTWCGACAEADLHQGCSERTRFWIHEWNASARNARLRGKIRRRDDEKCNALRRSQNCTSAWHGTSYCQIRAEAGDSVSLNTSSASSTFPKGADT